MTIPVATWGVVYSLTSVCTVGKRFICDRNMILRCRLDDDRKNLLRDHMCGWVTASAKMEREAESMMKDAQTTPEEVKIGPAPCSIMVGNAVVDARFWSAMSHQFREDYSWGSTPMAMLRRTGEKVDGYHAASISSRGAVVGILAPLAITPDGGKPTP